MRMTVVLLWRTTAAAEHRRRRCCCCLVDSLPNRCWRLQVMRLPLGQKDITKSCFSTWDKIFFRDRPGAAGMAANRAAGGAPGAAAQAGGWKGAMETIRQADSLVVENGCCEPCSYRHPPIAGSAAGCWRQVLLWIAWLLTRPLLRTRDFGDYGLVMSGVLENLHSARYKDYGMSSTCQVLDWLAECDAFMRTSFKTQDYQLQVGWCWKRHISWHPLLKLSVAAAAPLMAWVPGSGVIRKLSTPRLPPIGLLRQPAGAGSPRHRLSGPFQPAPRVATGGPGGQAAVPGQLGYPKGMAADLPTRCRRDHHQHRCNRGKPRALQPSPRAAADPWLSRAAAAAPPGPAAGSEHPARRPQPSARA